MIVVDTNVLIYLLIKSDHTPLAESLLKSDPQWAAPILWRSEFRNVLSLYLRRKLVTFEMAVEAFNDAALLLEGRETAPDTQAVLQLVQSSECSAYDCEFVALAQALGVPLVTMDKKILAQFPVNAISLADWAH